MTKQKFYELSILKTYQTGNGGPQIAKESKALGEVKTFSELIMKRAMHGFDSSLFPEVQPFDSLGFKYVAQTFLFVKTLNDDGFTNDFFAMLHSNPKLVDFSDEEQDEFIYGSFIDNIMIDQSWARELGDFIMLHGTKSRHIADVIKLAYGLAMCTQRISFDKLLWLREKFCYPEQYAERKRLEKNYKARMKRQLAKIDPDDPFERIEDDWKM